MIKYEDLPKHGDTFKMTVTMDVTAPQAYALMEMFKFWNLCGQAGMSRNVGFFVDGDGNFHPNCKVETEIKLPELSDEQKKLAILLENRDWCLYDFDGIAWSLHP